MPAEGGRRPGLPDFVLTGAFAALYVVDLVHHAMWRDEILAWAIAVTSRTPLDFLVSQHYDGHPALWHLLLWLAGQAVPDPVAIKLVHGAIGLALIGMVGLASPFSRLERALLLGGYFLVFEYTAVSRNYGIAVLLALLYARRRVRRPDAVLGNVALLALLANTNIFATILSGALALEYLADRLASRPEWRRLAAGAAIYAGGVLLVAATVWPVPDVSREMTAPLAHLYSPGHLFRMFLRFLVIPLVPIRGPGGNYLLYMQDFDPVAAKLWPHALVALALLGAVGWIFRRERALLAVFILTLGTSVVFGHLVYAIALRHWGIVAVAFLTCLWMSRERQPSTLPVPSLPVLMLLALGAAGGVQSLPLQWGRPFSMAPAAADWIARSQFAGLPLIVMPDFSAGMVGVLLGREMTMPECGCTARRPVFSAARDGFSHETLPQVLVKFVPPGQEALLVVGWPMVAADIAAAAETGVGLTLVRSFTGGLMPNEDFHVYRLLRRG